jgi:hypothetical protein
MQNNLQGLNLLKYIQNINHILFIGLSDTKLGSFITRASNMVSVVFLVAVAVKANMLTDSARDLNSCN